VSFEAETSMALETLTVDGKNKPIAVITVNKIMKLISANFKNRIRIFLTSECSAIKLWLCHSLQGSNQYSSS